MPTRRFLRHVARTQNPLAALREGVALLQDGVTGELTEGQKEVAQILHQNTLVLQSEIEALLRFNAAAFEARQLQRRETELIGLLEDLVESQRLQWQARQLRVEVSGERTTLQLDPEKSPRPWATCCPTPFAFARTGYGTLGRFARVRCGAD